MLPPARCEVDAKPSFYFGVVTFSYVDKFKNIGAKLVII